jgi:hypothetical protein
LIFARALFFAKGCLADK